MNFDLARIQTIFDAAEQASPVAVQNVDVRPVAASKSMQAPRAKTFAELYRAPAIFDQLREQGVFDDPALRAVPLTNAAAAAQARHVLSKLGASPRAASNLTAAAAAKDFSMTDLFERIFNTPPRTLMDVMQNVPNAPNPNAVQTWQWTGPAAAVAVAAGATVVATWQPSKSFQACMLAITAGANANTDQDDLAVGAITIAGATYNNSGIVPSLIYRPTSNTVPGVPNFAGPFVQQNSTISVTLINTGADALSVLVGMAGPTNG